ncbi:uncharacterized protein LOC126386219 [Epinephelus moara]|uniref:uncharacterized protein LOC126386219 n=1 Tax=Epinephelus moara TaxID=300413 RepID=UPI00214E608D|nr:uncharacterized protein LOC126386219 [Epinephelus moara]
MCEMMTPIVQKRNLKRLLTSEPGNERRGEDRQINTQTHRRFTAETLVSLVKTKMRSKLIYVLMMAVMSALLVITNSAELETTWGWTTPAGVTVCLRYLADDTSFSLLTISPSSRNPLRLDVSNAGYQLTFQYGYNSLYLRPNIRFWSNPGADIWTRVCLTLDSMKNVAQVFSGSHMSIRKLMPVKYAWSGQPVIEFSGFDGQMTDLQVWDYPLRYREVFNYMTGGVYMPYSGSVINWSYIGYTPRGSILLEDVYERQARQPISSSSKEGGEGRRKGHRPKGEKKTMKLYYMQSKSENNF